MTKKAANLRKIEDAWLGLDIEDDNVFNPMSILKLDDDDFHLKLTWLLSNPEYFSFLCKHILNIQIIPSQALILHEMWHRKFPMLIASRGFGKALLPETEIRVKGGWKQIKDLEIGDQVYASNGELCNVTGKTPIHTGEYYRITLSDNRSIECCEDHKWVIYKKGSDERFEVDTRDVFTNYKSRRYSIPTSSILVNEDEQNLPLHPHILGLLLSKGRVTRKHTFVSTDVDEALDLSNDLPEGYSLREIGGKHEIVSAKPTIPFYQFIEQNIGSLSPSQQSIPDQYKFASCGQRLSLLFSLFRGKSIYNTVSRKLALDICDLARSVGYYAKITTKRSVVKGKAYNDCYTVSYSDKDRVAIKDVEYVGVKEGLCITVDSPDSTYITKDYIVTHNSFMLALYSVIRALLLPRRKIVIVGAAFRQSKVIFEYMQTIWNNAPILRDICDSESGPRSSVDKCILRLNDSTVTALPLGNGDKIRGQRANEIVADEFASIPRDIFETVVAGFAAVSSDPVGNVKIQAAKQKALELGVELDGGDIFDKKIIDNQIIIAGTAYYDFNHFAAYWKKWKSIINSCGDRTRLREVFGGENPPKDFNWKDYSIIRIPYELLPLGFMDASQVARSKASVHAGIYQMEFGATFTRDSQGFFKRSLIENCVCSEQNGIKDSKGNEIVFEAKLAGERDKKYVFGVDPASEVDNFSIIIIELGDEHRKIVHCWTTTRSEHKEKVKKGLCRETDFYAYCARKIRDLMKIFPCVHISMDAQGGGIAVMESLHDKDKVEDGEIAIWPVIDEDKPKDTDDERGLHILEMCQFARYEWLAEANHGMRKDFEDKVLLFPRFDSVTIGLSSIEDELKGRSFDTLEECVMEIEELKDELAMIQITQTPNGRERWDTPEVIVGTGKKSRSRKDRYSALLMANAAGRAIMRKQAPVDYVFYGGFAAVAEKDNKNQSGDLFTGPSWYTDNMQDVY